MFLVLLVIETLLSNDFDIVCVLMNNQCVNLLILDNTSLLHVSLFKDEDPALRELAEVERDVCLHNIEALRQKVELLHLIVICV